MTVHKGRARRLRDGLGRNVGSNEDRRYTASAKQNQTAHWASVFDGRTCLGHVVSRGRVGVAAYDRHDRLIGIFSTAAGAATALVKRAEGQP